MSGHTVTIRVPLLKRQEHHLNALTGKFYLRLFYPFPYCYFLVQLFNVEVAGFEPTCNQATVSA